MTKHVRTRQRKCAVSAISLALCVPLFGVLPASAQEWCAGKVTDRDNRVVQRVEKPRARQSFIDPAFGTRVTRVTSAPAGSARRTLYSTVQPWNADESLLVLYHTDRGASGHHLYDGQTYEYIRQLEFLTSDIEEIFWDDTDSRMLYFVQKRPRADPLFGKLVRYDVDTRERSLAADLDTVCGTPTSRGGVTIKGGNDIQGMADGKIGLRCNNNGITGRPSDITFHVDVRTGEISRPVTIDPARPQGGNAFGFISDIAASPMHSGERVFLQGSVFDADMNFLYSLDSSLERYTASDGSAYTVPKAEHASIGRLSNGHDAYFSSRYDVMRSGCEGDSDGGQGALVAQDAQSGACRVLIGRSTGWGYPLSGVHVSAVSQQNLDWVTTTSIGYGRFDYLDNLRPAPLMFSELTLTRADLDDPETCRIAHLRTTGNSARRGGGYGGAYFGEPHAVMSPSGSRVLFNSDWYDSGSVDTYAVDLGTGSSGRSSSLAVASEPLTEPARSPRTDPSVEPPVAVAAREPTPADNDFTSLQVVVRTQESPPRVYVRFMDRDRGPDHRVTIAPAGSTDREWKMWLYTNGTQSLGGSGPETGRLGFLQQYVGRGRFEARLFTDGNGDRAAERVTFDVP